MDANDGDWIDSDGPQADGFNPYAPPVPVDESIDEAAPVGPLPGSPPGLSVTYRNDAADIAAYVKYFTAKFTKHRRNLRLIMGVILTLVVVEAVLFRTMALEGYRALIMVASMVGVWFWLEFAALQRKPRLPAEMPLVTLTLTPSGIVTREEKGGGTHRAWSAIRQIDDTDDHIYIFEDVDKTRVVMAHVVPRRAFPSLEDADEFLATARRWHAEPEVRPPSELEPRPAELEHGDEPADGLSVTFTMSPKDRCAEEAFYRSQQPGLRTVKFGLLLGLIAGTVFIVAACLRAKTSLWVPASALGSIYLIVGFLWWRMRSPPLHEKEEGAGAPVTIRIDSEGYEVHRGGINESSQTWGLVSGVGSNADFLIFPRALSSDGTKVIEAHLIPRSAFASPEAAEEFLHAAGRWHGEAVESPLRL